jgi:starvation-inducible DNA-binding protein
LLFEEHYLEMATAVDEIAERIRALGEPAPGTYAEFSKLSAITDVDGIPSAEEMVKILTDAHEQVVRTAREVLITAQDAQDESTASLVGDRMRLHEKVAWMLRSMQ